ncbi:hypothetical protein O9X98_15630 [Agrobacterium salinitolerans]|nr:hypothetical protein [Agrobacterium salinitolerans]
MKIAIQDTSCTIVTREGEGEWSGDDTDTSHEFGNAYLTETGDGIEVGDDFQKGDIAHIVIAVWSSGDSFSSHSGHDSEIMSAHKSSANAEESKRILETAKAGVSLPDGFEVRQIPWEGHFEHLDYITVEERVLQ